MKIIIDDKIPFIKGVLEPFGNVVYLSGAKISSSDVKDADALIVRTRTKCNSYLLDGSKVKFIATATIGFDHIDTEYCENNGITWTNAPGCNSGSVMQYIGSALSWLNIYRRVHVSEKVIGIVGVGNVGSKVERLCRALGMKVLLCDPIRKAAEGGNFVEFNTILKESDIITFHVPLQQGGEYPTYHMLNNNTLEQAKQGVVIFNTSRGEVVDTNSLKHHLKIGKVAESIIDVWENEPDIDKDLLKLVSLGTPHIAGYSADGKANGTAMSIQALARFFNLPLQNWSPNDVSQLDNNIIDDKDLFEMLLDTYSINEDSSRLKAKPELFEHFRGSYAVRREYLYYKVDSDNISTDKSIALRDIGFNITFKD